MRCNDQQSQPTATEVDKPLRERLEQQITAAVESSGLHPDYAAWAVYRAAWAAERRIAEGHQKYFAEILRANRVTSAPPLIEEPKTATTNNSETQVTS
jgi:hypothetical protein